MAEKVLGSVLVVGGGIAGMQAAIDLARDRVRSAMATRRWSIF